MMHLVLQLIVLIGFLYPTFAQVYDRSRRCQPGHSYKSGVFTYQCSSDGQYYGSACDMNGQMVAVGDQIETGSFVQQCLARGNYIFTKIAACVDENGFYKRDGEVFRDGKYLFRCVLTDKSATIEPVACKINLQTAKIGEQIVSGAFAHQCIVQGNSISTKIVACVDDKGAQKYNGEEFIKAGYIYRCNIISGGASISPIRLSATSSCEIDGQNIQANGKIVTASGFVKQCIIDDTSIRVNFVACIDDFGRHISNGIEFSKNGYIYRCNVNNDRGSYYPVRPIN